MSGMHEPEIPPGPPGPPPRGRKWCQRCQGGKAIPSGRGPRGRMVDCPHCTGVDGKPTGLEPIEGDEHGL